MKTPSPTDRRQSILTLTALGRKAFAPLEARSSEQVGRMIATLPESKKRRLVDAMQTVENLLGAGGVEAERAKPIGYVLRPPQVADWAGSFTGKERCIGKSGDMTSDSKLSARRSYQSTFRILMRSGNDAGLRSGMKNCRVGVLGEKDGEDREVAAVYVEPNARGLGIGARLVAECVRFARQAGYEKIVLWTQSELDAARHVYEKAGFRVVEKKEHHSFSKDLTAEVWELTL